VQPLLTAEQVSTLAPAHWVIPAVQALVQQEADPAGPVHAPLEQDEVTSYKQACGSCRQVESVDALVQEAPTSLQMGSALQEHEADPTNPVQLCRGPQAIAAPQSPLLWQVCMPLPEHWFAFA